MLADGATKGSVDRSQLHSCMSGTSIIAHELKLWKAKGKMTSIDLAAASGSARSLSLETLCDPSQPSLCLSPMADSMSRTVDAMAQLVMAGEGGRTQAIVTFENDKNLAAALAAAGEVPKGKSRVAGTRQGESPLITTPMVGHWSWGKPAG